MFTSADFISYFSDLEMFERNMHSIYEEALARLSDPDIRADFEALIQAEKRHGKLVEDLRKIIISKSLKSS